MPRERGAVPTGEEGEAVLQPLEHFGECHRAQARRRELDGERQPVQAQTNEGGGLQVFEIAAHRRRCTLAEELERRIVRQGADGHKGLAGDRQRLPAGCENAQLR